MEVEEDPGFEPNDEVDELRWLPPDEALELLTYDRDRDVLAGASEPLTAGSRGELRAGARPTAGRLELRASDSSVASPPGRPPAGRASGRPSSPWNSGSEIAGWPVTLKIAV